MPRLSILVVEVIALIVEHEIEHGSVWKGQRASAGAVDDL
jgi:hypothetical protein